MEIRQYTPDMETSVTQFYNHLTTNVPHCHPVTEEEFAIAINRVTTDKADLKENGLDSETAFVAIVNGVIQAFIHVGISPAGEHRKENLGVIRFLGYERGARRVGQAVLEKAEAYLKTFNVSQISAFPQDCRYRFYHFEHAYLSDALDQVQGLLGFNGYRRSEGEVFLDWEDYSVTPVPSSLPVTLSIDWKEGRGQHPNCTVLAHQDGEQVGICESICGGEFSSHPDAQDWFHTVWLGVEDDFQGQGLGRYLLQYTLQEMKKVGYRHAAISTAWDNHRAFLFYSNCGYWTVDWTYEFSKNLSEATTQKW
ncbi:MAG: GNAT family N-acetyltransferase [Candidatus Poribacteria bacterium]|nr:GNAT family N-acetyltransferase [Candidatus Poribacteria bacterium]